MKIELNPSAIKEEDNDEENTNNTLDELNLIWQKTELNF